MRFRVVLLEILMILGLFMIYLPEEAYGSEFQEELLGEMDFTEIQKMMDEMLGENSFSLAEAARGLMSGEQVFSKEAVQEFLRSLFFRGFSRKKDFL